VSQFEWKDWLGPTSVLIASIITQLVTVILVFANQQQTYKRYAKEKLWDLKRELYSDALSKLGDIYYIYEDVHPKYSNPMVTEEQKLKLRADEQEVFDIINELQKIIDGNQVIVSSPFSELYRPIHNIYFWAFGTATNDYHTVLAKRRKEVRRIHKALIEQARQELDIGK
jgi:hypothetical protein